MILVTPSFLRRDVLSPLQLGQVTFVMDLRTGGQMDLYLSRDSGEALRCIGLSADLGVKVSQGQLKIGRSW